MVEEIVEALRHADPLFCKLQNHKPDGSVYQLCLCLTPVFNVDGEGPIVNRHAERHIHVCSGKRMRTKCNTPALLYLCCC